MTKLHLPFHITLIAKPQTFVLAALLVLSAYITFALLSVPDEVYEEFIFGKDDDI